ncbi:MAG: 16S rRNA (adenine(1518)-N(6)/adenine(1519)-N(6))-dimethyltransferase RsmA [Crocinitomicaceae bacterium]|nr:16S rRNA (adenine(1518)-N(6)/adenine(1519)-N(6))-dimethyltransferase RsmA [Crocinitomicaceae bacterium]
MMSVAPKKHLGQHFLKDDSVSYRIAEAIADTVDLKNVLEIGPGMGALTKHLLKYDQFTTSVIEIDTESVEYLEENFPELHGRIYERDFLREDLSSMFNGERFAVVGNFPYNISSQILFKVLDYKDQVPFVVGMFQKEVAERVAEKPGTKKYGILSVLLQAYYDIEYLFTVDEHVFIPPPKVKSGVIRLQRNNIDKLDCDERLFIRVVKTAFNQRRKTLRNSLKPLLNELKTTLNMDDDLFQRRPETLSVDEFVFITQRLMV